MAEKEKAAEHHYNILLSESNQKLQSQELVIKQLTDSVSQKDLLLQVGRFQLRGKIAKLQFVLLCEELLQKSHLYLELILMIILHFI